MYLAGAEAWVYVTTTASPQIVSLLNDLDSCSVRNLLKSLDRSINLSGILHRYQHLYQQITFDLIQCVHNTRQVRLTLRKVIFLCNLRNIIFV